MDDSGLAASSREVGDEHVEDGGVRAVPTPHTGGGGGGAGTPPPPRRGKPRGRAAATTRRGPLHETGNCLSRPAPPWPPPSGAGGSGSPPRPAAAPPSSPWYAPPA